LAGLHFEVINKRSSAGPATVVRLIENPEMKSAVERLVRRLNLSGPHGFDFMLEATTGNAYLVEINPRITQVGHLALGEGRDLALALFAAMSGSPVQLAPPVTDNDVITLFPQEWMRDPASALIQSGYHDVPWEEPELVRACVHYAQRHSLAKTPQTWESSFSALCATRTTANAAGATESLQRFLHTRPVVPNNATKADLTRGVRR
jgi:biotin carboxylase